MNQDELNLEARLLAIEYMIGHLLKMIYRLHGAPKQIVEQLHAQARETFRKQAIPGVDAAQSDTLAAEIERHLDRILSGAEEMMGLAKKPSP